MYVACLRERGGERDGEGEGGRLVCLSEVVAFPTVLNTLTQF